MGNPITFATAAWKMARVIREPERLQDVIGLAAVLSPPRAMHRLVATLKQDPDAARAFVERPRVGRFPLARLHALPVGTLGRALADHLREHDLDPDALPQHPSTTDEEYLRAHMLESHDVWHVLTGFSTDVAGELGLQAFSLAQVGSPFALGILTGGLANTLLYAFPERDARLRAIVRGWLLGRRARLLFGAPWHLMWEESIARVREHYGLELEQIEAVLPHSPGTPMAQSC